MHEELAKYRDLNEPALLAECRWEAFRGSGPGGQKRNKSSNSIRLTHLPTGIRVVAGKSRSQAENKMRAVRRLKMRLALELRRSIDSRGWERPAWIDQVRTRAANSAVAMHLRVSHRNPLYPVLAGLVLDLLATENGHISAAAGLLGVSSSSLVRFLDSDPHLWTAAAKLVSAGGNPPLSHRK